MNNKIMESIEMLEDRIESIKWLIPASLSFKKTGGSDTINLIRKSAGILDINSPKGTALENKIRKAWKADFLKRRKG